jgi:hypothetical protein
MGIIGYLLALESAPPGGSFPHGGVIISNPEFIGWNIGLAKNQPNYLSPPGDGNKFMLSWVSL